MKINRCGWLALILLAFVLGGCGERRVSAPEPAAGELKVEAEGLARGLHAVAEEALTTGTRLRLRWTGEAPRPHEDPAMVGFCLPADRRVTAKWIEGKLDGQPVRIMTQATTETLAGPALPANAGNVEPSGMLRHWPIYSMKLPLELYDLLRRGDAEAAAQTNKNKAPDLELTLELTWPKTEQTQTTATATTATAVATPAAPAATAAPSKGEESWLRVARALVLNPGGVERYRVAAPPLPPGISDKITDPRRLAPGNRPWARLAVTTGGLTRLDPDDLLKAGMPADKLRPEAIRIFSHGQPVPLLVAPGPGAPAGMKPGVYFYAAGGSGQYSATRTYWVTPGEDLTSTPLVALKGLPRPAECQPLTVIRRTAARDIDNQMEIRHGEFMAFEGMDWVEAELEQDHSLAVSLELPHYVPDAGTMEAQLDFFISLEGPLTPYKVEVISDREVLGNFNFVGFADGSKKFTVPAHCVKGGKVDLVVRLVSEAPATVTGAEQEGGIFFNRFLVSYPAAPTLHQGRLTLAEDPSTTAPAAPGQPLWAAVQAGDAPVTSTLLAFLVNGDGGARGIVPFASDANGANGVAWRPAEGTRVEVCDVRAALPAPAPAPVYFDDLAAEDQGADLLIITHRDLLRHAEALKKFHESEGWRTRVADVQAVYDTFSDGELAPAAIKSLLAWTLRHWRQGAPAHVLLLGDCTSDYLNLTRSEVRNWVPTYSNNRGGEVWASDPWFTTISGEDALGDVMLGRLSAASDQDAATEVAKTIDYAAKPKPGPWRARLAWVSDDGEYPDVVEELRRGETPEAYSTPKIYLSEVALEDNWYLPKRDVERKRMKVSRDATTRILETFRRGVAFMSYHGHGSPNIWSDERIWFGGDTPNSDNQRLAGSGTCAFIVNMTCNSGAIDYPQAPWNVCITEDLMRTRDGGAIGCFVPSGPGVTNYHRELSRALARGMFDHGLRRMGEVTTYARAQYGLNGQNIEEMIHMYHLLGDPLVSLQIAKRRGCFTPRPEAVVPGSTLEWTLTDIEPAAGQWTAELTGADGHTIWSAGPADFAEGRIALKVEIPKETVAEPEAVLRVYAWDPRDGRDVALAGRLAIQRPQLNMEQVACGADGRVIVDLFNPGKVEAAGELSVRLLDNETSQALGVRPVRVGPGGKAKVEFTMPAERAGAEGTVKGAIVAEAALSLPEPPDDPMLPQAARRRVLAALPPKSAGWIRPLCGIDEREGENAILRVTTAVPGGATGWSAVLRPGGDAEATTQPLQAAELAQPQGDANATMDVLSATFTLDRALLERGLKGAMVTLEGPGSSGRERPRSRVLELVSLERRRTALRIVPGSIRTRPERPMDGETVFFDLAVENAGTLDSEPASVELLDNAPEQNGEPITDVMQNGPRQIMQLAPGRRTPVTLRWDPVGNAGCQTLYAHVLPASAPAGAARQAVPVTFEVRTKAHLEIVKVETELSPRIAEHRMTIRTEIRNTGQTDARGVLVAFYRTGLPIPENKLNEQEIKVVPGGGKVEVVYDWVFDPLRDMVKGTELPRPTVEVRLKGSSQRVNNLE